MSEIAVIGSGFSSLSTACYLAKAGHQVTVFEKNGDIGGRARQLKKEGFTFDMGPTWYWMPDVFERFFGDFDAHPSDYYHLDKLNPAYRIYFGEEQFLTIADSLEEIYVEFEKEEKGAAIKLKKFIELAKDHYEIAIKDLVYKPGESLLELANLKTLSRIQQFATTISGDAKKLFKSPKLQKAVEFPALFLGAKASDTPSFYSFMNYADFGLGTWYPKGGMYSVVRGIFELAISLGVQFKFHSEVSSIVLENDSVKKLVVNGEPKSFDVIVSGADYAHTETLLPTKYRQYDASFWEKKTFAPSALLFYVGFDKKVANIPHHALFFDADFEAHAQAIYDTPAWPKDPLFYASFPSVTDTATAPEGKEAGIFLIPIAPGLEDNEQVRAHYFDKMMERLEQLTHQSLKESVLFKESYSVNDFIKDYHSYKGNAYGLANTLFQTAAFRPKLKSKKVKGLYFTGQLTVPGPGVPPSLISGKLTSELVLKYENPPQTFSLFKSAAAL